MPALPPGLLLCPVCRQTLARTDRSLACGAGHRFDAARQGYVNLLTGKGSPFEGDSVEMVEARGQFLGSGAFDPLRALIVESALRAIPRPAVALDAGAGTGFYLEALCARAPEVFPVALDISRTALRRAARRLPQGVSLVWDVWRPLPVADRSVDVLLNVFAPRNPPEFTRVLSDTGCVVVVTPRPGHLDGLQDVGPLLDVPAQKADDVRAAFEGLLVETAREDLDHVMRLPLGLARSALVMGPAAHHRGRAEHSPDGVAPTEQQDHGAEAASDVTVQARFTVQVLARHARAARDTQNTPDTRPS